MQQSEHFKKASVKRASQETQSDGQRHGSGLICANYRQIDRMCKDFCYGCVLCPSCRFPELSHSHQSALGVVDIATTYTAVTPESYRVKAVRHFGNDISEVFPKFPPLTIIETSKRVSKKSINGTSVFKGRSSLSIP